MGYNTVNITKEYTLLSIAFDEVDGSAAADGLTGAYASLGSANLEATAPTANLLYGDGSFNNWIGENGFNSVSFTAAAIPEPTSGLLMLVGLAGLAFRRRRA